MGKDKQRQAKNMRHGHYKRRFKQTIADYEFMLIIQDGKCAMCGRCDNYDKKYFAIDHDHYTGNARGLLCNACNWQVGKAEHLGIVNEKLLEKVEKYLTGRVEIDTIWI